jgi:hypothetical protein
MTEPSCDCVDSSTSGFQSRGAHFFQNCFPKPLFTLQMRGNSPEVGGQLVFPEVDALLAGISPLDPIFSRRAKGFDQSMVHVL